jgi:hypothetical protein
VFSGPSENGFVGIHLLKHPYRRGLTTLKTRDASLRRKAVAVMRLYGRWRPLSIEVQGNLWGREAVSYRCRVLRRRVRVKPYNATLPNHWIGRAGAADEEWMKWPPRSPDLTSCDFFLWGYVKEQLFVPPLPLEDIDELKLTITAAVETIHRNVLERLWDELDYRLDICRVMNGAHTEHLHDMQNFQSFSLKWHLLQQHSCNI